MVNPRDVFNPDEHDAVQFFNASKNYDDEKLAAEMQAILEEEYSPSGEMRLEFLATLLECKTRGIEVKLWEWYLMLQYLYTKRSIDNATDSILSGILLQDKLNLPPNSRMPRPKKPVRLVVDEDENDPKPVEECAAALGVDMWNFEQEGMRNAKNHVKQIIEHLVQKRTDAAKKEGTHDGKTFRVV
ncbi:unnamed protein product [Amoebophrya sp. A25]|nr:unnamed protein product [Amoebophrya sp. A25]|eukprot:GSA25T00025498001.1